MPADVNLKLKVPPGGIVPLPKAPISLVTVWGAVVLFFHIIVVPTVIVSVCGLKPKPPLLTIVTVMVVGTGVGVGGVGVGLGLGLGVGVGVERVGVGVGVVLVAVGVGAALVDVGLGFACVGVAPGPCGCWRRCRTASGSANGRRISTCRRRRIRRRSAASTTTGQHYEECKYADAAQSQAAW